MQYYNQSLCYAENGSSNVAIAYSNRSAVLFRMNAPDKCLVNIQLAQETGNCPDHIIEKLNHRRAMCQRILEVINNYRPAPQCSLAMDFPSHVKYPFMSNVLTLRHDRCGRPYVIAASDLPANKVIAVDQAYTIVSLSRHAVMRCAFCWMMLIEAVVPCGSCTMAIYCGAKCRTTAWQAYHKLECGVSDLMRQHLRDGKALMSFRLLLCGWAAFGSLQRLLYYVDRVESGEQASQSLFDLDYSEGVSLQAAYANIHCLPKETKFILNVQIMKECSRALKKVVVELFKQQQVDATMYLDKCMHLLGKDYYRASNNAFWLIEYDHKPDIQVLSRVIFPFLSLLQMQEAANVTHDGERNQLTVKTLQPIKRGQTIVTLRYVVVILRMI